MEYNVGHHKNLENYFNLFEKKSYKHIQSEISVSGY